MINRCYNPASKSYPRYGGRGITVCTRWLVDFWAYVEDIEALERPLEASTLDRIDNDGPYDPRNVRWASKSVQQSNRQPKYVLLSDDEKTQMWRAMDLLAGNGYVKTKVNWWKPLGLKVNPYVYGPMPYKRTCIHHRRAESRSTRS